MGKNLAFATDDYVVYPSLGVGRITAIETKEIAGDMLEMYVVSVELDRLILRVPVSKAPKSGMRKLSSRDKIQTAMNALRARPRPRRAVMWSRRAQEYEAKINSGDPVSIAEVVRELHRAEDAEQSYSERQMYRAALERLAREVAAIERIDEQMATAKLQQVLGQAAQAA
jgi:CarD family transcriptional regulator